MTRTSKFAALAAGATALALTFGFAAQAQQGDFKAHFMGEWDANSDGTITLEEITARRGDVFASFDANDDGKLDTEEQGMMDEMRQSQHAETGGQGMGQGKGQGMGQGKGHGQGMGQGKGHGQGMGQGQGMGRMQQAAEGGMHNGAMIDTDGDGTFSKDEFVGMSDKWLARMDGNGDGVITDADF